MLIDFVQEALARNFSISGILHLGAHLAEEADDYYALGVRNVMWVEGNPDLYEMLVERLAPFDGQEVCIALIADVVNESRLFHISNYDSMSSSIFEFGTHTEFSPDTIYIDHKWLPTMTIDGLMARNDLREMNMLVMDLQGAELLALKGAEQFLQQVDYLYSEIAIDPIYVDGCRFDEVVRYLSDRSFKLVEVCWDARHGWGDALWVRV